MYRESATPTYDDSPLKVGDRVRILDLYSPLCGAVGTLVCFSSLSGIVRVRFGPRLWPLRWIIPFHENSFLVEHLTREH